ncbi:MAG: hypothetical protein NXI16_17300 [Alphaproteobacteria bacterium]|nr:hypothetical protein [Alphaproteobacteria bacterium]
MAYCFVRLAGVGARLTAFSQWFGTPSDIPAGSPDLSHFEALKRRVKEQLRQTLGIIQAYRQDYEQAMRCS